MATTILGKRSRRVTDSEDVPIELPRPKRQTRATVSIYEDRHDNHAAQSTAPKRQSCNAQRGRTARGQQRQDAQPKGSSKNVSTEKSLAVTNPDAKDAMDLENLPPSGFSTPTTIRHIDFLGAKIPSTPKHRVRPTGTLWSPRSSQKAQSAVRPQTIFSAARQLFTQSSNPTKLIGRTAERQQVQRFISHAVEARTGGCTYVSGPPGTGKSALVQEVIQEFKANDQVQISIINCVSLRSANDVYGKMMQDFVPTATGNKSSFKDQLSGMFLRKSKDKMFLVLLDEIDNLLDVDCEVLYTIFEWAMHKSSSMILVGIANALNLTDRFLPHLKARGLKPDLLPFLPYNAAQISTIITDKLRTLLSQEAPAPQDFVPLMHPAAIQLCGKKIASQTGDLRKAFSLVRRILEQVERETTTKGLLATPSKRPLSENTNQSGPPTPTSSPLKAECKVSDITFTAENAPRASIAHAAKIASSIFNNGTLSRLSGLNLQQKAVLCSLVAGEKRKMERDPYMTPSKSTSKIPSIKELFVKYSMLCKRDEGILQPLKDTEFRDVVASLETLGLVQEQRGRVSSLLTPSSTPSRAGRTSDDKQIMSTVSEKEMRDSLSGAGADLLRRLLDNE